MVSQKGSWHNPDSRDQVCLFSHCMLGLCHCQCTAEKAKVQWSVLLNCILCLQLCCVCTAGAGEADHVCNRPTRRDRPITGNLTTCFSVSILFFTRIHSKLLSKLLLFSTRIQSEIFWVKGSMSLLRKKTWFEAAADRSSATLPIPIENKEEQRLSDWQSEDGAQYGAKTLEVERLPSFSKDPPHPLKKLCSRNSQKFHPLSRWCVL